MFNLQERWSNNLQIYYYYYMQYEKYASMYEAGYDSGPETCTKRFQHMLGWNCFKIVFYHQNTREQERWTDRAREKQRDLLSTCRRKNVSKFFLNIIISVIRQDWCFLRSARKCSRQHLLVCWCLCKHEKNRIRMWGGKSNPPPPCLQFSVNCDAVYSFNN